MSQRGGGGRKARRTTQERAHAADPKAAADAHQQALARARVHVHLREVAEAHRVQGLRQRGRFLPVAGGVLAGAGGERVGGAGREGLVGLRLGLGGPGWAGGVSCVAGHGEVGD